MPYQDTSALERQVQALLQSNSGGSWGAGLADGIKMWAAAKTNKKIEAANKSNEQNQQRELAAILKGRETGRVGDSYASRSIDQYVPSDPELRKLMSQQLLGRTSDPSDLERYMGMNPDDQAKALEFRRNPYLNQGDQFTNVTNGQTVPINVSPDALPSTRGAQAAAVEAAETAAMPQQLAIENAAAVQREGDLAVAPRQRDADSALMLLDMAEPLLENATGSSVGTARDAAMAVFGASTEGGEAAAQLKAIGGLLISKMPRMQGPQSNLDVQLYREMAGQIGDSTVPADVRRAAIQTIRELNQKYASQAAPADDPITAADEILRRAGIIQ
jgi:uncharacterized protein (UPF0147 family)